MGKIRITENHVPDSAKDSYLLTLMATYARMEKLCMQSDSWSRDQCREFSELRHFATDWDARRWWSVEKLVDAVDDGSA